MGDGRVAANDQVQVCDHGCSVHEIINKAAEVVQAKLILHSAHLLRCGAFLQANELHAWHLGEGREIREWYRPIAIAGKGRIALPGNANF